MAKEKFIRGKRDNCNHDGLYSNRKREIAADEHLREYLGGDGQDFDEGGCPLTRTGVRLPPPPPQKRY